MMAAGYLDGRVTQSDTAGKESLTGPADDLCWDFWCHLHYILVNTVCRLKQHYFRFLHLSV